MIGHYLVTLTPEQEERVLTTKFGKFPQTPTCFVMACNPEMSPVSALRHLAHGERFQMDGEGMFGQRSPAFDYEQATARFGTERVNAAIRNRILSNQARRALSRQREGVPA